MCCPDHAGPDPPGDAGCSLDSWGHPLAGSRAGGPVPASGNIGRDRGALPVQEAEQLLSARPGKGTYGRWIQMKTTRA